MQMTADLITNVSTFCDEKIACPVGGSIEYVHVKNDLI